MLLSVTKLKKFDALYWMQTKNGRPKKTQRNWLNKLQKLHVSSMKILRHSVSVLLKFGQKHAVARI